MKKTILLIAVLLSVITINAQVKFTATAKKAVEVGEAFLLSFSVNANASGFRAPNIVGLQVLSGPGTSTSTSVQIINGRRTQSLTTKYTYQVRANKVGNYSVGPAKITVKGKTYSSNKLNVKVVKASSNSSGSKTSSSDIFVRLNLNKTSVYQGEPLTSTIKIYTKVKLVDFQDMKFPAYTGFWSQDIHSPSNVALQRETFNGKVYDVAVLKQTLLFPQKTGKLTIDSYTLDLVIQEKVGKGRNFFGQIVDRYERVEKKLRSPERTVNVKPIPGNLPDNFSGLTGSGVKFSATTDVKEITQDEGVTLKLKVSGSGNLKLLNEIELNLPASFEKYPAKVKENIKNSAVGSSGSKTFEYFFVAREPGNYRIPPIEFSYFDIKAKKIRKITSEEINIKVNKGTGESANNGTNSNSQTDVENLNTDIRFIKQNDISLSKKGSNYAGSLGYILTFPIGIGLLLLFLFLRRKKLKLSADTADNRNRKAGKVSKKRLKVAEQFLKSNDKDAFYKEISQATWGYLSHKLHIPVSELNKDKISEVFLEKEVATELSARLKTVLDTCEFAQYAPVGESGSPENIYKETGSIIDEMEKAI